MRYAARQKHSPNFRSAVAPDENQFYAAKDYYISNPNARYDNAAALRQYLDILQAPAEVKRALLIPWDNGYYLFSDGKSHPVKWLRLPSRLRVLGLELDPPSVLHDYRYYTGANRYFADCEYYENQVALGMPKAFALGEYYGLRAGGWKAWNTHAEKREAIEDYGTDGYILQRIGVTA